MKQFISDFPQPNGKKHQALIPEQQPLADQLGAVPEWGYRVRIVCSKCSERIGLVLETIVRKDGERYATQLGAVLRAARYDASWAAEWRADRKEWGSTPGHRMNDNRIYHAFIEHSSSARLPAVLPVACGRHGDRRPIGLRDLRSKLDEARARGGTSRLPIRA